VLRARVYRPLQHELLRRLVRGSAFLPPPELLSCGSNPQASRSDTNKFPPPVELTTQQDHRLMDGASRNQVPAPRRESQQHERANAVNLDESKANPYPNLPDPLVLKNGERGEPARKCGGSSGTGNRSQDFDAGIYGRVPRERARSEVGSMRLRIQPMCDFSVITKQLIGSRDTPPIRLISVDIQLALDHARPNCHRYPCR